MEGLPGVTMVRPGPLGRYVTAVREVIVMAGKALQESGEGAPGLHCCPASWTPQLRSLRCCCRSHRRRAPFLLLLLLLPLLLLLLLAYHRCCHSAHPDSTNVLSLPRSLPGSPFPGRPTFGSLILALLDAQAPAGGAAAAAAAAGEGQGGPSAATLVEQLAEAVPGFQVRLEV